ncbi:ShlB/FhaC/HecB family hemolysin secretion/activation protein [Pseudoalteromonas sp. SSDWG2]|uniref:ShlB/FhaC/HecB family hemolysin secretion/activation protein n=1 Tax=Pseudoalteromonas sp. SSDWG2 TaxID=3139391 RepID=UPI003BAC4856
MTVALFLTLAFGTNASRACANSLELHTVNKVQQEVTKQNFEPDDPQNNHTIFVAAYSVHGNTALTDAYIAELLQPFTNRELSNEQIHLAAHTLQLGYAKSGLFAARVIIPAQAVVNNTVTLHVYEGRTAIGGIELHNSQNRVDNSRLFQYIQNNIVQGELIQSRDYERVISLIERLPGMSSRATLYPGSSVGSANFLIETHDEAQFDGNIYVNNYGNYYTGKERFGAQLNINSPSKSGDKLSINALSATGHSHYGLISYDMPIGGDGARIGASIDYVSYKLGKRFASLDAQGDSSQLRLFASYPLIASRHANLNLVSDLFSLKSKDSDNTGLLSKRTISGIEISVNGDHDDDFIANGVSYFSLSMTLGDNDISGNDDYIAFDNANSKTSGDFRRINFELARSQHLSGRLSGFLSLKGQFADKNLDASQKFYIGGPHSGAGYPVGELSGDDAMLLYADIRYDLDSTVQTQASIFYSYGKAKLYHEPWPSMQVNTPQLSGDITLQSMGVGTHITLFDDLAVNLIIGKQVGSNLGADVLTGEDTDESNSDYRFWAQALYTF